MLDGILMKLLKINLILPSLLYLRHLIRRLLRHFLGAHANRHPHHLQRIWFHEDGECVATYILSC